MKLGAPNGFILKIVKTISPNTYKKETDSIVL